MKLCLAGTNTRKIMFGDSLPELRYVLESFYYINKWQTEQIKDVDFFLLDSGAFTFLNGKGNIDINEYLDKYIEYIKQNDVQYFFELDIDNVIGYEEVKRMRRRLERRTKKRCIPVWHKSRGIKEFKALCKKYDYIAIGGIVTKEIQRYEHFLLNAFCDYAHSQGCKIHGLGFTVGNLKDYKFDSVDSTAWLSGGRFGKQYQFISNRMTSKRVKGKFNYLDRDRHNLNEWLKYQEFLIKCE